MRERVARTLVVVLATYPFAIALVYLLYRHVFGFGEQWAYVCVGITVLLSLPIIVVRGVQVYRQAGELEAQSQVSDEDRRAMGRAMLLKLIWLALGAGVLVIGTLGVLNGRNLGGLIALAIGIVIVAAEAASLARLAKTTSGKG